MRIISLVPSLTELLIHLGLEDELVGRTKFCIHPADHVSKIPKVGGTKNVNLTIVKSLNPDLILANKEENTKEDIDGLRSFAKVHLTEISTYSEALQAILDIGQLTYKEQEAQQLVSEIENRFQKLESSNKKRKSVCYLIWRDPLMTIGRDTYIHDMLVRCGCKNVFGDQTRYPVITAEEIKTQNPDYIFLSSEPYPFKTNHQEELSLLFPDSKVVLVDGEYFSWYGSRMVLAAEYFLELISNLE